MGRNSIRHDEFIKLPTDQYFEDWQAIRRLNLGADLLIACVKHEPIIVRLDRWGEVHWEHNYSAVGNGADVARAMLCLQKWIPAAQHGLSSYSTERVPLEECLFRLKEAHMAAHKSNPSSVGGVVTYQVLTERHRASPKPEFLDLTIGQLVKQKHVVPVITRLQDSVLFNFQSLTTGEVLRNEPEDL